ncbi:PadR family transcriptional regulator [Actinophytocola sp. NPDC049390]|uniref:PadR family transcriptional regulator n=1 Tax=Actinophytocola sp. NPDC049390 TaxID=3363894 RepID=UPI0037B2610E
MADGNLPPLTPAGYQVLLALASGTTHGYAIMRFVDEATGGEVRLGPGTLYRTIARLAADGLLEETGAEEADARRRNYRLTRLGHATARRESALLARLVTVAAEAGLLPDTERRTA